MKNASAAACLAFALCFPLASARAAETTYRDESLRIRFDQSKRIGVEPKGHSFGPILTREKRKDTATMKFVKWQPQPDTIAVFSTDQDQLKTELPLAHYRIPGWGKAPGGKINLTLEVANGRLGVSATDVHGAPLAVERLKPSEIAQPSLPPEETLTKRTGHSEAPGQKPAAIGEAPGKPLGTAVGLRSAEGTFMPIFREDARPGDTKVVKLNRMLPGQGTADITVFGGKSSYLKGDRKLSRYLVSGLSLNRKAAFELTFTVTPAGKVELTKAFDSSLKKPNGELEVQPYSREGALRLGQNRGVSGNGAVPAIAEAPGTSAPRIVAQPFHY